MERALMLNLNLNEEIVSEILYEAGIEQYLSVFVNKYGNLNKKDFYNGDYEQYIDGDYEVLPSEKVSEILLNNGEIGISTYKFGNIVEYKLILNSLIKSIKDMYENSPECINLQDMDITNFRCILEDALFR